jgi:hypothetical protein
MRTVHKGSILSLVVTLCLAWPAGAGEAYEAELEIAEARAFSPVYDRYEGDLSSVRDRFVKFIEDYTANFATMSDEKASQIVEDFLAIERERAEVREKYLEPLSEALRGRKVARFYQIENKIQAVFRYELARSIPVVEQ